MRSRSVAWGLLGMVLSCNGVAQQGAPNSGVYRLSIQAKPLGDALSEFARQTGLQVMASSKLVDGVQSPELKGTFSADEALQKMLADTGLQFKFVNPHTVAINVAASAAPKPNQPSEKPSDPKDSGGSGGKRDSTEGGKKMPNRSFIARMLGLFAVCSSAAYTDSACAQESPTADEPVSLQEVLVTAQRREERLQDVPLTVVALSDDQLAKSGVTNIFDLQNVVSGLTYSGVGNSTQPAIRGLSTMVSTNGSENPNALYVDGVYYATNQLLGANLPDVDRIEVLKGPQGTLFGRNSVGGAIRIFTKDPKFTPTGDFTIDGGYYTGNGTSRSNPHGALRGFVSIPLVDDLLALSFSGGYDVTDGFMTDDTNGENYGKIERLNARTKLLWQPSDSIRAVFNAYYLDHDDEGLQSATPYRGKVFSLAPVNAANSIVPSQLYHSAYDSGLGLDINVAEVRNYGYGANIQFDFPEVGTLTSITDYNDNEVTNLTTFTHSRNAPACVTSGLCVDYSYFFKLKAFSQELNFVSEKFGMFRATAGLFYYHQNSNTDALRQATVQAGGIPIKSEHFQIDSYAAYGELEIQPIDPLTFIVGGRYTHEPHKDTASNVAQPREETFNSFIPRLTAKYAFTSQLNVYASYSVGEKSGLSGIANTASTPQYAPVDPEENHAYEIGIKYAAADFSVNLSAFHYDYKNKQEQGFTNTSVFLLNSGPVRIQGLDADASFRLTREFTFRTNASWVPTAEYRDFPNAVAFDGVTVDGTGRYAQVFRSATGLRLVKAPELTANATLDYVQDMSSGAIDASINVNYSSAVYHDLYHVMEQSAYTTFNARAGYSFGDMGLRLSLYGRNLTNKAYIANGFSSGQGFTAAYARPREVGVSLNYSY